MKKSKCLRKTKHESDFMKDDYIFQSILAEWGKQNIVLFSQDDIPTDVRNEIRRELMTLNSSSINDYLMWFEKLNVLSKNVRMSKSDALNILLSCCVRDANMKKCINELKSYTFNIHKIKTIVDLACYFIPKLFKKNIVEEWKNKLKETNHKKSAKYKELFRESENNYRIMFLTYCAFTLDQKANCYFLMELLLKHTRESTREIMKKTHLRKNVTHRSIAHKNRPNVNYGKEKNRTIIASDSSSNDEKPNGNIFNKKMKLRSGITTESDNTTLPMFYIDRFLSLSCLENNEDLCMLQKILSSSKIIRKVDRVASSYCVNRRTVGSLCLVEAKKKTMNQYRYDSDEESLVSLCGNTYPSMNYVDTMNLINRAFTCSNDELSSSLSRKLIELKFLQNKGCLTNESGKVTFRNISVVIERDFLTDKWVSFLYLKKPGLIMKLSNPHEGFNIYLGKSEKRYDPREQPDMIWIKEMILQKILEILFSSEIREGHVCVRLQNVIIVTHDLETHWKVLRRVLEIIDNYEIRIDPYRTGFCRKLVESYADFANDNGLHRLIKSEKDIDANFEFLRMINYLCDACDAPNYTDIYSFLARASYIYKYISYFKKWIPEACIYKSQIKEILMSSLNYCPFRFDYARLQNIKIQILTMKGVCKVQEGKPLIIYSRTNGKYIIGSLAQIESTERDYEKVNYIEHASCTFDRDRVNTYCYLEKQIRGIIYLLRKFRFFILENQEKEIIVKFKECKCEMCYKGSSDVHPICELIIYLEMYVIRKKILKDWKKAVKKYKITAHSFENTNCLISECIKNMLF